MSTNRPRQVGNYRVTVDHRILNSQRAVVATAFDESGDAVAQQAISTSAARGYLERDTESEPPTWEELEDIAISLLRLQLDEVQSNR